MPPVTTPCSGVCENLSTLDRLIAANPLLTEEERAVASPERLFYSNLRFAVLLANESKYAERLGHDAVPTALRGLWHASQTYVAERGSFTSWARWAIWRALTEEALSRNPGIKISRHAARMMTRQRAGEKLSETQTRHLAGMEAVFLDLASKDDGEQVGSFIASDEADPLEAVLSAEKKVVVERWMSRSLTADEQKVLRGRFGFGGEPLLLSDLAAEMGITRQRVEQIEKKALRKLRAFASLRNAW